MHTRSQRSRRIAARERQPSTCSSPAYWVKTKTVICNLPCVFRAGLVESHFLFFFCVVSYAVSENTSKNAVEESKVSTTKHFPHTIKYKSCLKMTNEQKWKQQQSTKRKEELTSAVTRKRFIGPRSLIQEKRKKKKARGRWDTRSASSESCASSASPGSVRRALLRNSNPPTPSVLVGHANAAP